MAASIGVGGMGKVHPAMTFSIDGKQYVAVTTAPCGEATSTRRLTPDRRLSTTTQVVVVALP